MEPNTPLDIPNTEKEFLWFKENRRDYLVRIRIDKFMNTLATVSLDDEKEKHICGRIAYGGIFNPASIHHEIEERQEVIDFCNYSDMAEFCKWQDDKDSFEEYIYQYMQ